MVIRGITFMGAVFLKIVGWKKKTLEKNRRLAKVSFSDFALYQNALLDLICFLLAIPKGPYDIFPKDKMKLEAFKKSGGLLLCAHMHNWELMGSWLCKQGLPILGYSQKMDQKWADALLNRSRKKINLPTVSTQVPSKARAWIEEKKVFGVLWDQNHPGMEAEFFSHKVQLSKLPVFLHQTSSCPVYFSFLTSRGKVRLLKLNSKKLEGQLLANRYHRVLEKAILTQPNFWYGWFHNRFKNKPRSEKVSRETTKVQEKRFHVKLEKKAY